MQLFAFAQTDFNLHARAFEINRQRNDRIAVLLGLAEQVDDLALVHEQLTHAQRVLIEDIAFFVRRNVHAAHENLTVLERTVGILEIDLSQTDGLYLGTRKLDARFILFLDKVVMPCLFVGRNLLCALFVNSHGETSLTVV